MNKTICFIIPTLSAGGAERVVSILANYYSDLGYPVTIICLIKNEAYPINKEVNILYPKFNLKRNVLCLLRTISYYRSTIKKVKPDVILSFQEFYNEIVSLALIGIPKKLYLFDRNNPFLKEQNKFQSFLRKVLYPKATGVVVQTQIAASVITKNRLNKNILVLPNPLSTINSKWAGNNNKTITCIGRIEHQKNHKYLIDIFSEIQNEGWILQIVGKGSLETELIEYCNSIKMQEKIKFLGHRKDTQEILSESTIFALPSLWEGFPNVLLEAMAIGVPCISNNCNTGPSELIDDGKNGFLIEIDNTDSFRKKLTTLMADENLRCSFSRESVLIRNKYSVEQIAHKLLNFLYAKTTPN